MGEKTIPRNSARMRSMIGLRECLEGWVYRPNIVDDAKRALFLGVPEVSKLLSFRMEKFRRWKEDDLKRNGGDRDSPVNVQNPPSVNDHPPKSCSEGEHSAPAVESMAARSTSWRQQWERWRVANINEITWLSLEMSAFHILHGLEAVG